ncbi:MAG: gamma-glutamylcyclotransferase [bacterium]|nr:gamma-glutamylcyclotransferase [bacterium]
MSDAASHVFTYGTLTIPRVMAVVTGHTFVAEPALLQGWARYALRGETYPGLVCEATAACDGVLWRQVDADSLRRLDEFEGDWYRRQMVTVLADGVPVAAQTYVLVEAQHHRVSHRRWLRDRFERRFLRDFLAKYASEP